MVMTTESNMCSCITSFPPQVMYLLFNLGKIIASGPVSYCHTSPRPWEADGLMAVGSHSLPPSCQSKTAIPSLHCFTSASPDITQASLNTETTNPFRTPLNDTPEDSTSTGSAGELPPSSGTPPSSSTNWPHFYLQVRGSEKQNLQRENLSFPLPSDSWTAKLESIITNYAPAPSVIIHIAHLIHLIPFIISLHLCLAFSFVFLNYCCCCCCRRIVAL